jgi:hypothetical protein
MLLPLYLQRKSPVPIRVTKRKIPVSVKNETLAIHTVEYVLWRLFQGSDVSELIHCYVFLHMPSPNYRQLCIFHFTNDTVHIKLLS